MVKNDLDVNVFFKLWFSASEKNKIITELRTFQVEKRRDVNNITISGVT